MFRPGRGKSFPQDKKHLEAIMPVDKNIAIIHQLQLRKKVAGNLGREIIVHKVIRRNILPLCSAILVSCRCFRNVSGLGMFRKNVKGIQQVESLPLNTRMGAKAFRIHIRTIDT